MSAAGSPIEKLRDEGVHVADDPEVVASYSTDWTGRFVGRAAAVVLPESADEVAVVIDRCRETGVALVPQGGNTGLVGGGVPLAGEIVLSLRRLEALEEVDELAGQVTAGAGVTIGRLHQTAAAAGWAYGVDLASRDSATVGGTIATNAGGIHMIRHGGTRAQVIGIEAVLGTGSVISHLGGLVKDNTGYHLPSLLCGSEGTLGVVTAARLRLVAPLPYRTVAVCAFATTAAAVRGAAHFRRALPVLDACELFLAAGFELVRTSFGLRSPFAESHEAYLLVEVGDQSDPTDALAEVTASAEGVEDVVVAAEPSRRQELWRYREGHTEAINALGPPHKLDVTLPAQTLAEFAERVPAIVAALDPAARTWLFGHVGDGNLHVNVTGVAPDDDRVDAAVFELVAQMGGSISAEHGIGTAKREFLHLSRTPAEIEAFRAVKGALDPDGILNPNALLPAPG